MDVDASDITRPTQDVPSTVRGKEKMVNSDEDNRTEEFDDDDFADL